MLESSTVIGAGDQEINIERMYLVIKLHQFLHQFQKFQKNFKIQYYFEENLMSKCHKELMVVQMGVFDGLAII